MGWHEFNRESKDQNRTCTDDDITSRSYGEVREHTSGYWFRSCLFCRSSFHFLCFHLPSRKTYFFCYHFHCCIKSTCIPEIYLTTEKMDQSSQWHNVVIKNKCIFNFIIANTYHILSILLLYNMYILVVREEVFVNYINFLL